MAAVSLDRYVKVYDCRKNKQIFQAYLKNRLNCTLLLGAVDNGDSSGDDNASYNSADEDSADDDVVEEFVDSSGSSSEDEDEEDEGENNSYADIEPKHKKQKKR